MHSVVRRLHSLSLSLSLSLFHIVFIAWCRRRPTLLRWRRGRITLLLLLLLLFIRLISLNGFTLYAALGSTIVAPTTRISLEGGGGGECHKQHALNEVRGRGEGDAVPW